MLEFGLFPDSFVSSSRVKEGKRRRLDQFLMFFHWKGMDVFQNEVTCPNPCPLKGSAVI